MSKPWKDMHCVRTEKEKMENIIQKNQTSGISTITNQILQMTIINAECNSGSVIDINDLESSEASQQSNANDSNSDWSQQNNNKNYSNSSK